MQLHVSYILVIESKYFRPRHSFHVYFSHVFSKTFMMRHVWASIFLKRKTVMKNRYEFEKNLWILWPQKILKSKIFRLKKAKKLSFITRTKKIHFKKSILTCRSLIKLPPQYALSFLSIIVTIHGYFQRFGIVPLTILRPS